MQKEITYPLKTLYMHKDENLYEVIYAKGLINVATHQGRTIIWTGNNLRKGIGGYQRL